MTIIIKHSGTVEREFIVPNCLCGAEPEVYEHIDSLSKDSTIYIRCPHCYASTGGLTVFSFLRPREECIELEAQAWRDLINKKTKNKYVPGYIEGVERYNSIKSCVEDREKEMFKSDLIQLIHCTDGEDKIEDYYGLICDMKREYKERYVEEVE